MAGLADFDHDAHGEFGGQTEARAEDFQDERIANADEFKAATDADAERFEPLRVLVLGRDAAHHGTDARRQFVQPDERNGLCFGCHNENKIILPANPSKSIRRRGPGLLAVCGLLSAACGGFSSSSSLFR
jgi:hypothetical protein